MTNTLTDDEIDRIIRYGTDEERAAAMDMLRKQQEVENAVRTGAEPAVPVLVRPGASCKPATSTRGCCPSTRTSG